MTNFERVKQEMRIEDVAIFEGLSCNIIHKIKNEVNCSDRSCKECEQWLAEEYVEHIKAKRNPINSCADLSRSMRGRRYGILYFTEEFRIDFENKMCELSRLKEKNKELEKENLMLKNTKNNCPLTSTSGINCNIKTDYISKDKIREKLDYQYELWNTPERQKEYSQDIVNILEELLKEE